MRSKYMQPRAVRRENQTLVTTFRGGKLVPVSCQVFRESESGRLSHNFSLELEPIAGRMITPITAEVVSVYVPALAIDVSRYQDQEYTGNTEIFREKLLSGQPVFGMEDETIITQKMGIEPKSVNGQKLVNEAARHAHNAAVNYLRQRKYVYADPLPHFNEQITNAIVGQTALDRLNAVLDPEDRVNGRVNLKLPEKLMFISGLGRDYNTPNPAPTHTNQQVVDRFGSGGTRNDTYAYADKLDHGQNDIFVRTSPSGVPDLRAVFSGEDSAVSLADFYRAELQDELSRQLRKIVDDNPEHGEEIATRFAHGLDVDVGKQPFEIYRQEKIFGMSMVRAMDGANLDQTQTHSVLDFNFDLVVPPSEFGGIVITFVSVKPDETLPHQPHPILSEPWGGINYLAEEMAIDPVPIKARDVYAGVKPADEETVVMYGGNNGLLRNYVNYGFTRDIDASTVENRTAVWQLELPLSVTPTSIIYPDALDHYPFSLNAPQDDIVTITGSKVARINTPRVFGPTPVEELAVLESENLLEE